MNYQFVVSLVMLSLWVLAGVVLLIAYPRARFPLGEDSRVGLFWMGFVLMILWNLLRAYLCWKPARRKDPVDDPPL
jgi:hypothetical protein